MKNVSWNSFIVCQKFTPHKHMKNIPWKSTILHQKFTPHKYMKTCLKIQPFFAINSYPAKIWKTCLKIQPFFAVNSHPTNIWKTCLEISSFFCLKNVDENSSQIHTFVVRNFNFISKIYGKHTPWVPQCELWKRQLISTQHLLLKTYHHTKRKEGYQVWSLFYSTVIVMRSLPSPCDSCQNPVEYNLAGCSAKFPFWGE